MSSVLLCGIQGAVIGLLKGDASLTAISSAIFDHIPENTALPAISVSIEAIERTPARLIDMSRIRLNITLWSDYSGKKQVLDMAGHVEAALHYDALKPEIDALVMCASVSQDFSRVQEGNTHRMVMQYDLTIAQEVPYGQ